MPEIQRMLIQAEIDYMNRMEAIMKKRANGADTRLTKEVMV